LNEGTHCIWKWARNRHCVTTALLVSVKNAVLQRVFLCQPSCVNWRMSRKSAILARSGRVRTNLNDLLCYHVTNQILDLTTFLLSKIYESELWNGWWVMNWKVFGKKSGELIDAASPEFAWRNTRKSHKKPQDSWCHDRDSNRATPIDKSTALPLGKPARWGN
jgi:hypothetical protein